MGFMQKMFLIEETEVRQTADGRTYGVAFALAKTKRYRKLRKVHIPNQFTAKFASSKEKFLLIKTNSQKEKGLISNTESSMVILMWSSIFTSLYAAIKSIKYVNELHI